jgi:NO-binding membrane sensor protein with MHYT domain
MILEVAMLNVRSPMESEFEVAFTKASAIIASLTLSALKGLRFC